MPRNWGEPLRKSSIQCPRVLSNKHDGIAFQWGKLFFTPKCKQQSCKGVPNAKNVNVNIQNRFFTILVPIPECHHANMKFV